TPCGIAPGATHAITPCSGSLSSMCHVHASVPLQLAAAVGLHAVIGQPASGSFGASIVIIVGGSDEPQLAVITSTASRHMIASYSESGQADADVDRHLVRQRAAQVIAGAVVHPAVEHP